MPAFTAANIADQSGKTAIVTGATGGLGYETALLLAGAGARVILAGRNGAKGADALTRIRALHSQADIAFETLDLASLASVTAFADRLSEQGHSIDILVNNAGVMAPPTRQTTPDGFELQFATNYLSHFALTARLLPLLMAAPAARVVPLSSIGARQGKINLDDLQSQAYRPMVAYCQSKLACLMFAFELQRRSDANGWGITSIAAHPGVARTDLLVNGMGKSGPAAIVRRFLPMLFQSVPQGALPTLLAATAPEAQPGGYYGPQGFMELRGTAGEASPPKQSLDRDMARRLWDESEILGRVPFPVAASAA